ncbi:MAG: FAA hydrolase family protein, partial [Actinomycetota bacterium]|nr:FAA hydrolase family protein [Actinomycetota bacterium]
MSFKFANIDGRASVVEGGAYFDLERISKGSIDHDPRVAIGQLDEIHRVAGNLAGHDSDGALADAKLNAPVPSPRNSFGVGLNYKDHAEESKMDLPKVPVVFTKYPSCITGPFDEVCL